MADMRGMTVDRIAAAVGGAMIGCCDMYGAGINAVVADSREVTPGCLFAAIPGERVDGHDFIDQAFEKGALCCLSEKKLENPKGICILVDSTVGALCKLAEYYRSQLEIPIIGVTGSVGKTTAKEMVASVLEQKYRVLKTEKNFNNNLGVPLTVLRIHPEHEAAVIEMGISHFGEMREMARIVRPDIALYTNIGEAHLEFLHDRSGVLRAKGEMLEFLQEDGTLIVNGDDDLLSRLEAPQRIVRFGTGDGCEVRAEALSPLEGGGMSCTITDGQCLIPAEIPAFGTHMVYAALEGAAVGLALGLTPEEIAKGIAAYETVGDRARLESLGSYSVVNDCYNANPTSARAGIDSLATLEGRKVAILGDMLELGADGPDLHRALGAFAAERGTALVIACGSELAEQIAQGALGKGTQAQYFSEKAELIRAMPGLLQPGDAILVKASHSLHFEDLVEEIRRLAAQ